MKILDRAANIHDLDILCDNKFPTQQRRTAIENLEKLIGQQLIEIVTQEEIMQENENRRLVSDAEVSVAEIEEALKLFVERRNAPHTDNECAVFETEVTLARKRERDEEFSYHFRNFLRRRNNLPIL